MRWTVPCSRCRRVWRAPRCRGVSLVEAMVGIAIALLALAWSAYIAVDLLGARSQALAQARLSQDTRLAADIMVRELRRAGHWQSAHMGVSAAPRRNAYTPMTPPSADGAATEVTFASSRDDGMDNDRINDRGPNERFGYRRSGTALQSHVGGAWQDLVDAGAVAVQAFEARSEHLEVSLGEHCRQGGLVHSSLPSGCCRPDDDNPALCKPSVFVRHASGRQPTEGTPPSPGMVIHAQCPALVSRRIDLVWQASQTRSLRALTEQGVDSALARAASVEALACP